jgi:hypothetical protein
MEGDRFAALSEACHTGTPADALLCAEYACHGFFFQSVSGSVVVCRK